MKHAFSRMILSVIQLLAYVLSTCVKILGSVKGQSQRIEYSQELTEDGYLKTTVTVTQRKSTKVEVKYD